MLWGAVKETNDHASFNSWDRQSWFWQEAHDPATVAHMRAETQVMQPQPCRACVRNNVVLPCHRPASPW